MSSPIQVDKIRKTLQGRPILKASAFPSDKAMSSASWDPTGPARRPRSGSSWASTSASPELDVAPAYLVGFALLVGLPLGSVTGDVGLSTWTFTLLYLTAAVATRLVAIGVGLRLNKETVLASR